MSDLYSVYIYTSLNSLIKRYIKFIRGEFFSSFILGIRLCEMHVKKSAIRVAIFVQICISDTYELFEKDVLFKGRI